MSDIITYLRSRLSAGKFMLKSHGGQFQASGMPDIILIAPGGRFVGLEVKRPRLGRLTELQKAMIRRMNECGGYACVVYGVADVEVALNAAIRGDRAPEIN